ncbi:MAG TPA: hypothetical protein VI320_14890 [Terracidiphilus sp.]
MKLIKFCFSLLLVVILGTMAIGFLASRDDQAAAAASKDPNSLSVLAADKSADPSTDSKSLSELAAGMAIPASAAAPNDVPAGLILHDAPAAYTDRVPMLTRALSSAPGAVVCSDSKSVKVLFAAYTRSAQQHPNPHAFGCIFMTPGTNVLARPIGSLMDVVALFSNGTTIHGVTMNDMLINDASAPTPPPAPVNPPASSQE